MQRQVGGGWTQFQFVAETPSDLLIFLNATKCLPSIKKIKDSTIWQHFFGNQKITRAALVKQLQSGARIGFTETVAVDYCEQVSSLTITIIPRELEIQLQITKIGNEKRLIFQIVMRPGLSNYNLLQELCRLEEYGTLLPKNHFIPLP